MSRYVEAEAIRDLLIRNIGLTNGIDTSLREAPSIDLVRCGECELKRLCDNAGGVDDWNYCYWGRRMKGTDDEER